MKKRKNPAQEDPADPPVSSTRHPAHRHLLGCLAAERYEWAGAQRRPGSPRRRETDVERALGRNPAWFSDMLRGESDLGLDLLFHYLDALGLAPADFFARAFPVQRSPVDELVRRLRTMAGPRYPALRAERVGPVRRDDAAYSELRARMEPLDNLQKEDPRLAVTAIRAELAKATDTRMEGHWLALLTVAYKGALRLDKAAACALVALDLAALTDSPLLRVDALVYGSSLLGDNGQYALCADVMLEALVAAGLSGDADARGRALFKRGLSLMQLGAPREALEHYRAAGTLLATDHWKFAAYQASGVAALEIGDTNMALGHLAAACRLTVPRSARGFACWLHAETAAVLGMNAAAAESYAEARALLDLSHPADWVLVAAQEARALIADRRRSDATRILMEAIPVAEALNDSGPAGAVKAELLAAVREGGAALERLERLSSRMRAASPLAAKAARTAERPKDRSSGR